MRLGRKVGRWGAVMIVGVTAGCLSPAGQAPELIVEVPEQWTSRPEGQSGIAAEAWWESFGDPRLTLLIEEALEHNQNLAAAAARLLQAEQRARIAGANRKPQLSAGVDAARSRRNFIGFPIPGSDAEVLSSTTTSYGVSLDISWEVDLWGRLRAGVAAAAADLEAASWDLAAARLSLCGQTAKAWFALREAERQLQLAQETLSSRQSTEERIRRRYELGLRSSVDFRLAAASEGNARASLAARERELDGARRQLEILLGRYPKGLLESAKSEVVTLEPVRGGLPAELLSRRPDLRAAESRAIARGAQVAQARAALLPQIRLTGSAGRASEELADLLDGDFSIWSLASGLLQPLFQGGRLRAGVSLAEAAREEAAAHYLQAALVAFAEVEATLVSEEFLEHQESGLAKAAEQARGAQKVAERRYLSGLADYLEVLESQRQAVEFHSRWLEVRRQRLTARVDLHLALGGGFRGDGAGEAPSSDSIPSSTSAISR